jgi:hypothetical protein
MNIIKYIWILSFILNIIFISYILHENCKKINKYKYLVCYNFYSDKVNGCGNNYYTIASHKMSEADIIYFEKTTAKNNKFDNVVVTNFQLLSCDK